jgi:hypothetical protein
MTYTDKKIFIESKTTIDVHASVQILRLGWWTDGPVNELVPVVTILLPGVDDDVVLYIVVRHGDAAIPHLPAWVYYLLHKYNHIYLCLQYFPLYMYVAF